MDQTFRERTLFAVFAAVIIGIVVVSRLSVLRFERSFVRLMESQLFVSAHALAVGTEGVLRDSLEDLLVVANDPALRDFVGGRGPEPSFKERYHFFSQYYSFSIFDAAGRCLSGCDALGRDGAAEVGKALASQDQLLGAVTRDPGGKETLASLTVPLAESGKVLGAVRGTVRIGRLVSNLETKKESAERIVYILDRGGRVVYYPDPNMMGQGLIATLQKRVPNFDWSDLRRVVERMTAGEEGVMVYRTTLGWDPKDVRPLRRMVAFSPFSFAGDRMSLAASIDYDAAIQPVKTYSRNVFIAAEFLILIFFAGGFALFRARQKAMDLGMEVRLKERTEAIGRLANIGRFSANVAHQVNNPLMIISGRAQLSLMGNVPAEETRENLKVIVEQCERAKGIVRDLLQFSRPEAGERESADLNEIVAWACDTVAYQFKAVGITLKRDLAAGLPRVAVVKKQMADVLLNLLINAREAITDNGTIEVATTRDADRVRLDIKDPGHGMNEATLKRVFDPFYTTKDNGTGLGLSIVYGIVQAHGGEIKFASSPGEGTTVSVWLPGKV